MSRKKLKEMLKREMDTRINSYSSKPSKSDDEKPLINTITKTELLGKPKEEVRFEVPKPSKKVSKAPEPVKEEVKEEPVKEERPQTRSEETRPRDDDSRDESRKIDKRYSFDSDYSDEDSYSSEEESEEEKKYSEDESEDDYKNYKRPSKGKYDDEELSEKQKYGPNYGRKLQKEPTDEEILERQKYGQMYERKQQEREYKKYQDTRGREDTRGRSDEPREDKKSSIKIQKESKNKKRDDSVERPREDTRGREDTRDERISSSNPFIDIHKKSFLQLIKSNDINNISGDCVDELKDILNVFLVYMFEQFAEPDRTVMAEAADVKTYMSFYLEDEDKELPQDLAIPSRDVERGIMMICDRFRIKIRKDVVYLVHMFAECILLKVIKGALMINDLGKAKRLSGKEIRTAYKIYMM
jgi:hypothetical protein